MWYSDGEFIGDGITELEKTDDAASMNWGGSWRMPTNAEWQALCDPQNYKLKWIEDYNGSGISGVTVTSKVPEYFGNQIFLPAGTYWSSSLNTDDSDAAWSQYINAIIIGHLLVGRNLGQSIRAVSE